MYEKIIEAIINKFRIIGAAAATANLLCEFRIPEKKDDKLTNSKKGKVILVNSIASLNFNSFSIKPGAIRKTKNGVNISASIIINSNTNEIKTNTSSANFLPDFLLLIFSAEYPGIKAALNVPSANSLLKVFGSRKATKKASA